MAITNKTSALIDNYIESMNKCIGENVENNIYSCWVTFNYVANNLNLWADDTVIGSAVKDDLVKLCNIIFNTMTVSKELINKINEFNDNQKQINGGGYVLSKGEKLIWTPQNVDKYPDIWGDRYFSSDFDKLEELYNKYY